MITQIVGTGEEITFHSSDAIVRLSIQAVGGTCVITGNNHFRGQPSVPLELPEGTTVTVMGAMSGPIDGLTVAGGTGSAYMLASTT